MCRGLAQAHTIFVKNLTTMGTTIQAINEAIDLIIAMQHNSIQGEGRYIEDGKVFSVLNGLTQAKMMLSED